MKYLLGHHHISGTDPIGVRQLAAISLLQGDLDCIQTTDIGEPYIYDLDTNVAWYACGRGARIIEERFETADAISALDLPPDVDMEADSTIRYLVAAFRKTGKDLYRWDLTMSDIADLGFAVERVWSPDTLSLPLPSAPQLCHRRFKQYGRITHGHPHPYP
jgi:hypothetical protein